MELESIKKIATQLDSPNVPEVLESRLKQLSCEQTRITIAGGANVGKTTLINVLANTDLEVSSIPPSSLPQHHPRQTADIQIINRS